MLARAILNNPDLVNPLPNLPTGDRSARFLATDLTQTGAGEGIRTPDPLITNQMLYRLSYASRCKLTIILIGRQIARKTGRFFSAAEIPALPDFPPATPTLPLTPETLCSLVVTGTQHADSLASDRGHPRYDTRPENGPSAPSFTDTLTIRTMCAGLRLLVQVFHRVYGGIVDNHFVVQMWTRRLAGHSHGANDLPALYFLAHDDKNLAEMPVLGRHPISVIHDDLVTVAGIPPRLQDDAITRRTQLGCRNGARISTPEWKTPSPLKGSKRWPKPSVICPRTGQMEGTVSRPKSALGTNPNAGA